MFYVQAMAQRLEGAAAQRERTLEKQIADMQKQLQTAQRETAEQRTAAGSGESKARALEKQLEEAHRKALTEVQSERKRLQVRTSRQISSDCVTATAVIARP